MALCGLKTVASMGNGGKAFVAVAVTVGLVAVQCLQLERDLWHAGSGKKLLALCFYLSFVQILLLPLEACSLDYSAPSLSISFLTIAQLALATVNFT